MKLKTILTLILTLALLSPAIGFANPTQAAVKDWQKGVSLYPAANNDFASDKFKQSLDNAKAINSNMATFIVPYYQFAHATSDIQSGWNTPTDASLATGVDYAHSIGMDVTIKIHMTSYVGDAWAALINPSDRTAWFNAYEAILNKYADFAKTHNVEQFILGNEMTGVTSKSLNADNTTKWRSMISGVKSRYSGVVTYNANWGGSGTNEEKNNIEFWDDLDHIGISGYYNLSDDKQASWDQYNKQDITPLSEKFDKKIMFTEIGYRSVDGSHTQPWNYTLQGNANEAEQYDNYEQFFKYWNSSPTVTGLNLWHWETNPNAGGPGNKDYTIQNKSAQTLVQQWFLGIN